LIVKEIDKKNEYFNDRIITRDEYEHVKGKKTLSQIFPGSTDMALILDDRYDVWNNNLENLLLVIPCKFYL
jgi:TFIIF-interacting CTD phosphatase-like protein